MRIGLLGGVAMWILSSESRGVEYASRNKADCLKEMKRLIADDKESGYADEQYYIEKDDSGFYQEGKQ